MTPSAVLFDCDGVIVDSEPITDEIIAASLARHGLVIKVGDIHGMFLGGTMNSVGEEARRLGADLPESWVDDIYEEMFERLARDTPLIPGITAVFDALDAAGIPYAVGSNGPHRKMAITLGQHPDLYRRLRGRVFSRHDVARPKPAPDLYLHAARALGVPPSGCVVIEDSPTGARAAAAAGMRCFGYAATSDATGLQAAKATPFRSMADLPTLLGL